MNFPYLLSKIYHHISKRHVRAPINAALWPAEWKTTEYKSYPRLPKIQLLNPDPISGPRLFETIAKRKSIREFMGQPITLAEFSSLLKFACGTNRYASGYNPLLGRFRHFRVTPSAGARFPIETYIIVLRDQPEIPRGVYHYDVLHHRLDLLRKRAFSKIDIEAFVNYPWARQAAFLVVLTAVFARSQRKYGERGYRYIHLEAGHIGQNFYLTGQALGFKGSALTGIRDDLVEKLLDIDGNYESYIFSLAFGK